MSHERSHDGAEAYGPLGGDPLPEDPYADVPPPTEAPPIDDHGVASDSSRRSAEDEAISVVPFPVLDSAALIGLPGKIVDAIEPYTEAHPAAMLVQLLAQFGATVGHGAHVVLANRRHPAKLHPLIVGKTSDGAKGTSYDAVAAVYTAAERSVPAGSRRGDLQDAGPAPVRLVKGLSSGEGLIDLVRDESGHPNGKQFDEGMDDKRLLVLEDEYVSTLSVMDRQGSILPRIVREAWDGDTLSTLTRSPRTASGTHIIVIGHCTPGELRVKLRGSQVLGGTLNRMLPVASRRTRLLPDGGNIPDAVLNEYGPALARVIAAGANVKEVECTDDATELWHEKYAWLRRPRPDGAVASTLARAAPQVIRMALTYALADHSTVIAREHMAAALAIWRYVEQTAEWMFGTEVDSGEVEALVAYIADGGDAGRSRTEISSEHYQRNRKAALITATLSELIADGRIRQKTEETHRPGRRPVRYYAC